MNNKTNQNRDPKEDNNNTKQNNDLPSQQISLPKGGGAIRGIGEKFSSDPFTGTCSLDVPVFTTPSRSDFYPKLSLSYNSAGIGNGPFGAGWNISIPSMTRKTEKGLPRYMDAQNSDTFILSGAEDLVPSLKQNPDTRNWDKDAREETLDGIDYTVEYYRPRIEGLFALIKKCTDKTTQQVHWRSISKDNITTIYGRSTNSKITDPDNHAHVFKWMIEESYDDKGNVIAYEYTPEDDSNIDRTAPYENNRLKNGQSFANKYIKRIRYGNQVPHQKSGWLFEVVFDYGEHDINNNPENETQKWSARQDPFSSYRSGFEIRTYRLCKKIMMFHNFAELGGVPYLVRSTDLEYVQGPVMSFLKSITQTGYIKNSSEGTIAYKTKSIPPLEFDYAIPDMDTTVHRVDTKSMENIPVGLGMSYKWVDLQSEGISGILSQQDGAWFYKHNLGNAEFGPMQLVATIPSTGNVQNAMQITDLEDDGQKYLVRYEGPISGYYKLKDDGTWDPFTPFQSMPNIDWKDSNLKFVDIDGDGHPDILISQSDIFVWYRSKGREGFESYLSVPKTWDEEKGPALVFADAVQSIYLADMSGDGLTDIVRIRNGEVCYWPNIGYGKFGNKITLENSPLFDNVDQFDNSRIRLADIDGSGTSDIIYLGRNGIKFWFNQSGNSLSEENRIENLPLIDNLSSVMVLDLFGNGTSCIVWSSPLPENTGQQMKYIDLMKSTKPYLLYSIKNNMGSETRIGYTASTKFYLEDLKAGKPWITKLPFPVHVVERIETYDYLSNTKLVSTMKYHHGYYDRHEREFRGFGLVEHWDTESFDQFNESNLFSETPDSTDEGLHVPPVYSKTWYHTGAYHKWSSISRHYEKEYYQGDQEAALLPDSVLPPNLSQEDMYEAFRALKGQVLRQEVYSLDCSDSENDPYAVSEHNYNLVMFQPAQHRTYGVFYSHELETMEYHYERNPADPRVEHKFVLKVDEYGNVEKQVTVFYPRRVGVGSVTVYPEQSKVKAIANLTDYTHIVDRRQDTWLVGIEYQSKSYEINGLALQNGSLYFDLGYIDSVVLPLQNGSTTFNVGPIDSTVIQTPLKSVIDFGVDFTDGQIQARVQSAQRKYYWQDDSQTVSQLVQIAVPLLSSYTETAVFPQSHVNKIYGSKVSDAILTTEGGYQKDYITGYWWNPGKRQYYLDSTGFYLPNITVDPFGSYDPVAKTGTFYQLDYDKYDLVPVTYTDPLGNQMVASKIDYRLVKPTEVIDFNGNHSQAACDELGMVVASSIFGTVNGTHTGDGDIANFQLPQGIGLDDILANTDNYIQNATALFYYDYLAWKNDSMPPYSVSVQRVIHQTDQSPSEPVTYQISILYNDGQGRTLQKKLKAESGLAWTRQDDDSYIEQQSQVRWITSGRTVYNNKGKPVKQYEPFYSASYNWDSEKSLTEFGVTPIIHYDPLERVIRTDTPKGFFSSVVFDPWSQENWDENDNILESNFYDEVVNKGTNPHPEWTAERLGAEKVALQATASNSANTPKVTHLDTLGHIFMEIDQVDGNQLFTYYNLDIHGNKLSIVDPRQYLNNQNRTTSKVLSFQFFYDMQKRQLESISMDAGTKITLQNALNKPIYLWTARGYQMNTKYDSLQRPVTVTVTGNELTNNLVEKILYGESLPILTAQEKNQRGQPIDHYDQGGIKKFQLYDIEGHNIHLQTKIREEYKKEVDWKTEPTPPESFITNTNFDALGKITSQIHTDGSGNQIDNRQYQYHQSGRLKSIEVQLDQSSSSNYYVTDIMCNAKSQRTKIQYGNGTTTTYVYEKETFRLESLTSTISSGKTLQDLSYVYDPVGNITWLKDDAQKTIFYNQQIVDPISVYDYDSLYRLVQANGRQHHNILPDDYKNTDYTSNTDLLKQSRYMSINDSTALENYCDTYQYDYAGNLVQLQHVVQNSTSRGWTRTNTYADDSNRLQTSTVGNETNSYTCDDAGNMTSLEQLRTINWNYRDNMSSVVLNPSQEDNSDTEYYVYDSDGMRVRKVLERYINNGVTIFLQTEEKIYLDGYEIKRKKKIVSGNTRTVLERFSTHVMDDKNRIAIIHKWNVDVSNSETYDTSLPKIHYQLGNHLGSCILELDATGQIINYEEYYPFGGTSFIAGTSASASLAIDVSLKDYRYAGKECDDSTSLYYYGARYYIPWLCRWLSCDPIGIKDNINLYVFVKGNPIRFTDPTGTMTAEEAEIWVKKLKADPRFAFIDKESPDRARKFSGNDPTHPNSEMTMLSDTPQHKQVADSEGIIKLAQMVTEYSLDLLPMGYAKYLLPIAKGLTSDNTKKEASTPEETKSWKMLTKYFDILADAGSDAIAEKLHIETPSFKGLVKGALSKLFSKSAEEIIKKAVGSGEKMDKREFVREILQASFAGTMNSLVDYVEDGQKVDEDTEQLIKVILAKAVTAPSSDLFEKLTKPPEDKKQDQNSHKSDPILKKNPP